MWRHFTVSITIAWGYVGLYTTSSLHRRTCDNLAGHSAGRRWQDSNCGISCQCQTAIDLITDEYNYLWITDNKVILMKRLEEERVWNFLFIFMIEDMKKLKDVRVFDFMCCMQRHGRRFQASIRWNSYFGTYLRFLQVKGKESFMLRNMYVNIAVKIQLKNNNNNRLFRRRQNYPFRRQDYSLLTILASYARSSRMLHSSFYKTQSCPLPVTSAASSLPSWWRHRRQWLPMTS